MEQKEIDIIICNQQAKLQFYLQSNQAMIDYSKMACRGALLINGAAIIPIIYSKVIYLYTSAFIFGLGAAFAVLASCFSYITQWKITQSLEKILITYPFRTLSLDQAEDRAVLEAAQNFRRVRCFRWTAFVFVALSIACFALALWQAYTAVPYKI